VEISLEMTFPADKSNHNTPLLQLELQIPDDGMGDLLFSDFKPDG
jgi:hypothetical protein